MKLLRFGPKGAEKPGLLDAQGDIRDLSDHIPDLAAEALSDESMARLRALDPNTLPKVDGDPRIGACVGAIGKFICIGLNYADHAAESGLPLPQEPLIFMKATTAICGPNDDVEIPRGSEKTDWEVELGVVIGTRAKYVSEADALNHVAGYCVVNDVSERDFQIHRTGQWTKGKSHDTFGPVCPWLVTRYAVNNPEQLDLYCAINGQRFQDGNTNTLHFGIATIISHLSQFMTLEPGDIIATGTPPGVGMGMKPPLYLKPGDVMELGVEGLGVQRQALVQA